jgi:hypothetical protein
LYTLEKADLDMKGTGRDGALYLLSDSQARWDGRKSELYYRVVSMVSEPDALSDAGS